MFRILLAGALLMTVSIAAASPDNAAEKFPLRGMKGLFWEGIEKYYKAVPWMADHDMNWLMLCYSVYPESGRDWRKDYTPQHIAEMKELVTRANDKGITVCLSYNPGIWSNPPLCHSSEEDYQASWRKIVMAHSIGISEIALCLDDIAKGLVPADKTKYGTLEAAQMDFVNRTWADMQTLDPSMKLIFCPSAYTTEEMKKYREYTGYVGRNLAPGVEIFWTGPQVCSPKITVQDAREAEQLFGRKPFVWDNYPVNDMFPWRPLLGPVKGRDPHLANAVSGILFNPMKQWEANRIPMVSVAEYLNNPVGYDPDKAVQKILKEFPENDRAVVSKLLSYYGSSFWGEKGFPPAPRIDNVEAARKIASDLNAIKSEMTATTSSLNSMWEDIKETVDADIRMAEMISEAPMTTGTAMVGGAPDLALKGFGETAGLVYAKPTGKSRLSITLKRDSGTSAPLKIRLFARNGDRIRPRVLITLEGHKLAEGMLDVSQTSFEALELDLPANLPQTDKYNLLVENLETTGTLGMPPWFAVKWVQLLP